MAITTTMMMTWKNAMWALGQDSGTNEFFSEATGRSVSVYALLGKTQGLTFEVSSDFD